jgi:hypothetical protein
MVPATEAPTQAFGLSIQLIFRSGRRHIRRKDPLVPFPTSEHAEDTKRFDLVSYALVFLIVVFALEAMVAALIW